VYLIGLDSKGHLVTVTKTVWVGGHLAWLAVLGLLVAIANLVWVGAERRRWRRVRQIASGAPGFV
jgi:hypothetical protein